MKYIKEALSYFFKKENLIFLVSLTAVTTAASFLLGFVLNYFFPQIKLNDYNFDYQNTSDLIIAVVFSILSILLGLYTSTLQYLAVTQKERNIKLVLLNALKNTPKFLGFSFVVGLIVLGGIILLVIPGIIFGIWYSFTLFVGFNKKLGLKDSLKESKRIVSGNWWRVLGNFILFGLFSILVQVLLSSAPYVGPVVISLIAPLFLLPSWYLYQALEGKE